MSERAPVPLFFGKIEGGKISLDRRDAFQSLISRLNGQDIEITLRKRRRKRSLNQNAYFHGVVVPMLAEVAGYEDEEMKSALKGEFLRVESPHEGWLPRIRGTHELTTVEFNEFIEQCRRLGAKMYGIYIPDPGEYAEDSVAGHARPGELASAQA